MVKFHLNFFSGSEDNSSKAHLPVSGTLNYMSIFEQMEVLQVTSCDLILVKWYHVQRYSERQEIDNQEED